jgi:hypothetical protein
MKIVTFLPIVLLATGHGAPVHACAVPDWAN